MIQKDKASSPDKSWTASGGERARQVGIERFFGRKRRIKVTVCLWRLRVFP